VDVSLLRASLALMSVPLTRAGAGDGEAEATGELTGIYACYGVYRCRDGRFLAVGALEPKFWQRLCAALGRPELAADQWATGEARVHARAALSALFASRTRDEWVKALADHDVCVEPVLALDELGSHPVTGAELWDQPAGSGTVRTVAPSIRFGGAAREAARPAPARGADTRAVLAEAGFAPAEVERMSAAGVVG
jgi:crotonobetainyl-CoA:carnitine CoA-transferase CaiB-like acyl-CoA transferase